MATKSGNGLPVTSDGKPTVNDGAGGNDFLVNAAGNGTKDPPRNLAEGRKQSTESASAPDSPHLRSRPAGKFEEAIRPDQIARGGKLTGQDAPNVARQGAGSIGNNRPPFRGMK